jgi:hypothetical protein
MISLCRVVSLVPFLVNNIYTFIVQGMKQGWSDRTSHMAQCICVSPEGSMSMDVR